MEPILEVLSVDVLSGRQFVIYFSDETVVTMSASELADCFPKRSKVRETDEDDDLTISSLKASASG